MSDLDQLDHRVYRLERQMAQLLASPEPVPFPVRRKVSAYSVLSSGLYCTFCGRSQEDVAVLIAGPASNFICDGCVDLCRDIVEEKRRCVKPPRSDND